MKKASYTLQDLMNMRGFYALTQGEGRIEQMLLDNCNRLKGKVIGFIETRRYVLHNEFDKQALYEFVQLVQEYEVGNEFLDMFVRHKIEQVVRDFVPLDMVAGFVDAILNRISSFGGNIDRVCEWIEIYLTKNDAVPVAKLYDDLMKEMEEGVVYYSYA